MHPILLKTFSKYYHFRNLSYTLVLLSSFIPIFIYSLYSFYHAPVSFTWFLFNLGLLTCIGTTLSLLYVLKHWETFMRLKASKIVEGKVQQIVPQAIPCKTTIFDAPIQKSSLSPQASSSEETVLSPLPKGPPSISQEEHDKTTQSLKESIQNMKRTIDSLSKEIHLKDEELKKTSKINEQNFQELKNCQQQFSSFKQETQTHLEHKDALLTEYQQNIAKQTHALDEKQKHILSLEKKVRDLNYEVKTLLQMGTTNTQLPGPLETTKTSPSHPLMEVFDPKEQASHTHLSHLQQATAVSSNKEVHTPYDAAVQLHKCIEKAQKLRGVNHLGGATSRFSTISLEHYAIDLRRLFDSFRNETSCTVLIYSLTEKKLLFVNNQIKNSLGWSPEKFVKDFHNLIHKGKREWKQSLENLKHSPESQSRLLFQTKSGKERLVHCHLGVVPKGAFANHVIGVLFPI